MPAPVVPWEPCNIPGELQDEFNRRKINRSFRYVKAEMGEWASTTGDWSKYRGPMSPWVRFCSNSRGKQYQTDRNGNIATDEKGNSIALDSSQRKEGFILFGGKGFYADYGFTKSKDNPSIIGYVPDNANTPHIIDNDLTSADYPIHVPAPEIERIQVTIQKEHYRRASVEWVCFSKKQLEYMTPYFLVPGISCIMEWGWNHYNPVSLVNLADTGKLKNLFNNPYPLYTKNILQSRGNYDVIFGIISNFEWTVDGNKFRCKTEITSKDRIYAGLLVDAGAETSNAENDDSETPQKVSPLNSLIQFADKNLDQFRNIIDHSAESIPELAALAAYITEHQPKHAKEYLTGVFMGRDPRDKQNKFNIKPNKSKDFDKDNTKELWLNFGLIIEMINYHSQVAQGVAKKEMFRIDIDDVVVSAHPNMISCDETICLIPNHGSPHYHWGVYGRNNPTNNVGDYDVKLKDCDDPQPVPKTKGDAKKSGRLADFRLYTVCGHSGQVLRDNIDQVINSIRYQKGTKEGTCAFPFIDPEPSPGDKPYPAKFSGYLRHVYINVQLLKSLLDSSGDVQTYYGLVEKILMEMTAAGGNFWDLRIENAQGDQIIGPTDLAPMKIVDHKFMYFSNRGKVWTFDYFDADSLLLGIGFKPTLSNAQAIRTMYAPTNRPNNVATITNGSNELLDYHFDDRLDIGRGVGNTSLQKVDRSGFEDTMRGLQAIPPVDNSVQMTTDTKCRRLALPAPDILQMLLDDSDEDNNPKYTGVMPGIQATFTIQGIGGLRTFMMFLVRNLPEPYSEKNIVFRITDVQEIIEAGKWTTEITAGVIPLRGFIKARLGIT